MGQVYRRLVFRAAAVAVITFVIWAVYPSHEGLTPRLRVTVVTAAGQPIQGAQVLFLNRNESEFFSAESLLSGDSSVSSGAAKSFGERSAYAVTDAAGKATLIGQFDRQGYRWRSKVEQGGLLMVAMRGFLPSKVRFGGAELGQQILDGTVTLTVQLKKKAA